METSSSGTTSVSPKDRPDSYEQLHEEAFCDWDYLCAVSRGSMHEWEDDTSFCDSIGIDEEDFSKMMERIKFRMLYQKGAKSRWSHIMR